MERGVLVGGLLIAGSVVAAVMLLDSDENDRRRRCLEQASTEASVLRNKAPAGARALHKPATPVTDCPS